MTSDDQLEIADGTLVVRTAREGDVLTIALCGELDLANAATAEAQLDQAFEDASSKIIIDMRELEFIDSTGIALLVATLNRDGGDSERRVRFIPSPAPAVSRVLELTGLAERLPPAEA